MIRRSVQPYGIKRQVLERLIARDRTLRRQGPQPLSPGPSRADALPLTLATTAAPA